MSFGSFAAWSLLGENDHEMPSFKGGNTIRRSINCAGVTPRMSPHTTPVHLKPSPPTLCSIVASVVAANFDGIVDFTSLDERVRHLYVITPFSNLSSDILNLIMSSLKSPTTMHIELLIGSQLRSLDLSPPSVAGVTNDQVLQIVGARCRRIQNINLSGCKKCSNKALFNLVRCIGSGLKVADFSGTRIANNTLGELGLVSSSLSSLRLVGCSKVTDIGIAKLIACTPMLTTLDISYCSQVVRVSNIPRSLRQLNLCGTDVDDTTFSTLKSLPNLQLFQADLTMITDTTLSVIGCETSMLTEISISGCSISSRGLGVLAHAKHLVSVDIAKCNVGWPEVQALVLVCKGLTALNIGHLHGIWLFYLAVHARNLEVLDMSHCTGVRVNNDTGIAIDDGTIPEHAGFPNLTQLNMTAMNFELEHVQQNAVVTTLLPVLEKSHRITSLNLSLNEVTTEQIHSLATSEVKFWHTLRSLDVSFSPSLDPAALHTILDQTPVLEVLSLIHCKLLAKYHLHEFKMRVPWLTIRTTTVDEMSASELV